MTLDSEAGSKLVGPAAQCQQRLGAALLETLSKHGCFHGNL